jgi:hypothetical protein
MPGPYDGVREASQYLQDHGVPREYRRQALQSFVPGTIEVRTAGPEDFGLRHWGGESRARGYYLSPTLPATRSELALPGGNTMEHLAQFQIPEGSTYFTGRVGPNFGHPGGGVQHYIPDPGKLVQMQ